MQLLVLTSLLFSHLFLSEAYNGYYWREYTSRIPPDAVIGGRDVNGKQTYIGQTYLHNLGIFVMQIFPGESNTDVAGYGIKKPSAMIKILCSKRHEKFYWLPTSAKSFHLDTTGKHPVIGGYDHVDANKGMLHVGRLTYQGGIKIGSVAGYLLENVVFSFVGGNAEKKANAYEVLMFDVSEEDAVNSNSTVCTY